MIGFLNTHFYLFVLLGGVIFSMPAKKRKHFVLRVCGGCLLCVLFCEFVEEPVYALLTAQTDNLLLHSLIDMLRSLLLYGISTAVLLFSYQYSIKNAAHVAVFGYTLQHMTLLLYYLCRYYFRADKSVVADTALFCALYSGAYLFEFLLLRKRNNYAVNIDNLRMTVQSIIFLFCSVVLSVLSYDYIVVNETLRGTPAVFVVSAFGIVMCVNIIIGLLDSFHTRRVQDELVMTRRLWQEDVRQYELTKQTVDILNFRYHDLKNQMTLLVHDQAVAKEIGQCLDSYSDSVRTGNDAMDVVLTEKSILCRKHEIDLTCMADSKCLAALSPVDVYSVLGNLIDNAVEYLCQIPDKEKRIISLSICRDGAMNLVQIENYLEKEPQKDRGLPVTTKSDKENHGFGLRSVQYILKKHDGIMRVATDDNLFSVTIALPHGAPLKI